MQGRPVPQQSSGFHDSEGTGSGRYSRNDGSFQGCINMRTITLLRPVSKIAAQRLVAQLRRGEDIEIGDWEVLAHVVDQLQYEANADIGPVQFVRPPRDGNSGETLTLEQVKKCIETD